MCARGYSGDSGEIIYFSDRFKIARNPAGQTKNNSKPPTASEDDDDVSISRG